MGKTSKPLFIVALPPCDQWDELKKFEEQGHRVIRVTNDPTCDCNTVAISDLLEADMVIGERCWRMTGLHVRYLPLAIKEARMHRYPSKDKRSDSKLRAEAAKELEVEATSDDQ